MFDVNLYNIFNKFKNERKKKRLPVRQLEPSQDLSDRRSFLLSPVHGYVAQQKNSVLAHDLLVWLLHNTQGGHISTTSIVLLLLIEFRYVRRKNVWMPHIGKVAKNDKKWANIAKVDNKILPPPQNIDRKRISIAKSRV